MSLQPIDKLALRIYKGGRGSDLDEHPLVAIGVVPNTFQPRTPSLVNEPEVWILIHAQEYTLYSYFITRGETDCNVEIYLFVPVNMKLSADDNPYSLLSKAFDYFKKQGNTGRIDTTPFELLLTGCVLEERPNDISLPIMTGNNPASFCAESRAQVSALLRFSQYQQLSNIGHLEIGYQCNTTVTIPIKILQKTRPIQEQKPRTDQRKSPIMIQESKPILDSGIRKKTEKRPNLSYLYVVIVIIIGNVGILCNEKWLARPRQELVSKIVSEDSLQLVNELQYVVNEIDSVTNEPDTVVVEEIEEVKSKVDEKAIKVKVEILAFVNQKNLQACRNHPGWNRHLTKQERYAVEAVLNMEQYKGTKKKHVENLLKGKHFFNNWDELMRTKREIRMIQGEF